MVRDTSAYCSTCGNQTNEINPSLDLFKVLFDQLEIKTLIRENAREFIRRMIQCANDFYRKTDFTKYINQDIKIIGNPNPIVEMIRTVQQYL